MDVFLRTVLFFAILLFMVRLLGRNQMGQLTYFNYISGITLGEVAAHVALDESISLTRGVISVLTWTALSLIVGYLTLKSAKARLIIDGQPLIIIKKGKIMEENMAKSRLNMDSLKMLLRAKDVFSVTEVEYAILESNGEVSILKKNPGVPQQKQSYIPSNIIVDGRIIQSNLDELNLSAGWLDQELRKHGASLSNLDNVFFAELQEDGTLHVDKREDGKPH